MSVYKPKGSEIYVYDFQRRGHRFSGTTEKKTKREADEVERKRKREVHLEQAKAKPSSTRAMTLEEACQRYWNEVGQFTKRPDLLEWSMTYIMEQIGRGKFVDAICDDDVAAMVAKRRGEFRINAMASRTAKKKSRAPVVKKPPQRISAATVNRTTLEPLKRILLKARSWGRDVQPIKWKDHRLKEPKERIRSMSAEEQTRLFAHLPAAFHPIVRFAIRTGCRAGECCNLKWSDINWGDRRIQVLGKGEKVASIPMEARVRELLWSLQAEGVEYVFRLPSGQRILYPHYYSVFLRACRDAGIVGLRIHDLRHTAATRLVQRTGNIKMAMKLLRHEDISTTAKYAAVIDDDLRNALDAMPEHEVPDRVPLSADKALKENEK